jgi:hypothetical protein
VNSSRHTPVFQGSSISVLHMYYSCYYFSDHIHYTPTLAIYMFFYHVYFEVLFTLIVSTDVLPISWDFSKVVSWHHVEHLSYCIYYQLSFLTKKK